MKKGESDVDTSSLNTIYHGARNYFQAGYDFDKDMSKAIRKWKN